MLRRALLLLVCVATVIAGCGDGDDDGDVAARATTSTSDAPTTSSTTSTTRSATAATTTTTAAPPPPVTAAPKPLPFAATIKTVTAKDLYASWRPGCPVPVEQLRAIDVRHFGNDGAVHTGRLIVAANLAEAMVDILHDLYDARFPIARMEPIDVYGGDD